MYPKVKWEYKDEVFQLIKKGREKTRKIKVKDLSYQRDAHNSDYGRIIGKRIENNHTYNFSYEKNAKGKIIREEMWEDNCRIEQENEELVPFIENFYLYDVLMKKLNKERTGDISEVMVIREMMDPLLIKYRLNKMEMSDFNAINSDYDSIKEKEETNIYYQKAILSEISSVAIGTIEMSVVREKKEEDKFLNTWERKEEERKIYAYKTITKPLLKTTYEPINYTYRETYSDIQLEIDFNDRNSDYERMGVLMDMILVKDELIFKKKKRTSILLMENGVQKEESELFFFDESRNIAKELLGKENLDERIEGHIEIKEEGTEEFEEERKSKKREKKRKNYRKL